MHVDAADSQRTADWAAEKLIPALANLLGNGEFIDAHCSVCASLWVAPNVIAALNKFAERRADSKAAANTLALFLLAVRQGAQQSNDPHVDFEATVEPVLIAIHRLRSPLAATLPGRHLVPDLAADVGNAADDVEALTADMERLQILRNFQTPFRGIDCRISAEELRGEALHAPVIGMQPPPASVDELLSTQFRLLREDMLQPSVAMLKQQEEHPTSREARRIGAQSVYNAHPVDVQLEGPMACILFRFDVHHSLRKHFQTMNKAKEFRNNSSWFLSRGGLVLLKPDDGTAECIAEVVLTYPLHRRPRRNDDEIEPADDAWLLVGLEFSDPAAERRMIQYAAQMVQYRRTVDATTDVLQSFQQLPHFPVYTISPVAPNFAFAFPILNRLKLTLELPFAEELAGNVSSSPPLENADHPVVGRWPTQRWIEARPWFAGLDEKQRAVVSHVFDHRVSLVQGPPGTGKTYIGVKIAEALLWQTKQAAAQAPGGLTPKLLLVCYTNHALDQFCSEIIASGAVRLEDVARIGGGLKDERLRPCCIRTHAHQDELSKRAYGQLHFQLMRHESHHWSALWQDLRRDGEAFVHRLPEDMQRDARDLQPVALDDGWQIADGDGGRRHWGHWYQHWLAGGAPNELAHGHRRHESIWNLSLEERRNKAAEWEDHILQQASDDASMRLRQHSDLRNSMQTLRDRAVAKTMAKKRIIACTTSGAAKYFNLIRQQNCQVVIAEEAGEILEAHLLISLTPQTKQLILIGDHKQLRPKCDHYPLSVESGRGVGFNRSLFERLTEKLGCITLQKQYRMRPEISRFVRAMTYPDLLDADQTRERSVAIRGLQAPLVFIDHGQPEDNAVSVATAATTSQPTQSHRNTFEAEMIGRTVKYLIQQGYAADDIVVLTAYLGQLVLVRNELKSLKLDAMLNERDQADLEREGRNDEAEEADQRPPPIAAAVAAKAAKAGKQSALNAAAAPAPRPTGVRISTVDNFQGEEADIIIASLVRCNNQGRIGFLREPERVNVLLSRARKSLLLFGCMRTLCESSSAQGRDLWQKLWELWRTSPVGLVQAGLPVCCVNHPEEQQLMRKPADFDSLAPAGGCGRACTHTMDKCGHPCSQLCHPDTGSAHTNGRCKEPIRVRCDKGHVVLFPCYRREQYREAGHAIPCQYCKKAEKLAKDLQKKREAIQEAKVKREQELELKLVELDFERQQQLMDLELQATEEGREQLLAEAKAKRDAEVRQAQAAAERQDAQFNADLRRLQAQADSAVQRMAQERLRQEQAHAAEVAARQAQIDAELERTTATYNEVQTALNAAHLAQVRELKEATARRTAELEESVRQARQQKADILAEQREHMRRLEVAEQRNAARLRAEAAAETAELVEHPEMAADLRLTCAVCMDENFQLHQGTSCHWTNLDHFVCAGCVTGAVDELVRAPDRLRRGADVPCVMMGAGCKGQYSQKDLYGCIPEALLTALQAFRDEIMEQKVTLRLEKEMERRAAEERARSEAERALRAARTAIEEDILTWKCPRCKSAFDNWDGCAALSCNNCRCNFCAWCNRDCGADAHQCAARCGGVHARIDAIRRVRRQRQQAQLDAEFARIIDGAVRAQLVEATRRQIEDAGLRVPV